MNWSSQRKVIYGISVFTVVIAAFLYIFRDTLFPAPTCFDRKQNAHEGGIDCGGTCSLRCTEEIIPLSVLWARPLKTSLNKYDFVGMVSNKNIDNAPRSISYLFTAYTDKGETLLMATGTTIAPIDGDFPIVLQNITLLKDPKNVSLQITDGPHYSVSEKPTAPSVRVVNPHYESGTIPRVYATILNTKRVPIVNLPVRVVLFDVNNNAYGAGETVIPYLDKEGIQTISFTWDAPLAFPPAEIRVYPIFDPFTSAK